MNLIELKNGEPLCITLCDQTDAIVGELVSVTIDNYANVEIVTLMSDWRNQSGFAFLTTFKAEPERTKNWLKASLSKPDQLLFLIKVGEEYIGHIGITNLAANEVEIDNVLKGRDSNVPQIMGLALNRIIQWLHESFPRRRIYLHVIDKNQQAIGFYLKNKFVLTETIDLYEKLEEGYDQFLTTSYEQADKQSALKLCRMEYKNEQ